MAAAGALAVALAQWWPAFRRPFATGFGDWQMVHHNWEAARIAVARFGEWPLWDPFHCGGVTILGNPESQVYSPFFLLAFALGSVLAVKVFLVTHVVCALLGMFVLARRAYGCGLASAALAACVWGLSGFFAWHGAGGHATFLPFAFAPWLVLAFRRGLSDRRFMIVAAALLALTLFEGGTYPFPYFLLLLAFEMGVSLSQRDLRIRTSVQNVAWLALLTGLLGAARLGPIAVSLTGSPRLVESGDALAFSDIWLMLTAREHPWRFPPHPYVWPEYGTYVGIAVLVLALAGAALCARRGPRHLLLGLLLFGTLMLGSRGDYYPWPLLRELPVYDSLRVPSRFAVLFTFYLALLAALAFERASALLRARAPALGVVAAAVLVAAQVTDMLIVNHHVVDRWRGTPIFAGPPAPAFHMVLERSYHEAYASYPQRNIGTPVCYVGGMNWSVSPALWDGPAPQVRVAPEASGRILDWRRTTTRLRAQVELRAPATLIWNQNHAPGFRADRGRLREDQGRLAIDLPAGRHTVEVSYAPSWFAPSLALSGLGVALSLVLWRRARRS